MTANLAVPSLERRIAEALLDVMDPELGIDIVNLGLVYDVGIENGAAVISMTLTTAACPLTDIIESDIASALDGIVPAFRVNWVWMPPWNPGKITDDGKQMLESLGFRLR